MANRGKDALAVIGKHVLHTTQNGRCLICGERMMLSLGNTAPYSSVEHVHSFRSSPKGTSQVGNIALSHFLCNQAKGGAPPTRCEVLWLWLINRKLGFPEEMTAPWDRKEGDCSSVLQQAAEAKFIVNR